MNGHAIKNNSLVLELADNRTSREEGFVCSRTVRQVMINEQQTLIKFFCNFKQDVSLLPKYRMENLGFI